MSRGSRSERAAERRARGGWLDRLQAWRELQLYSLVSSFGRMAARPWATALTTGVMAVALALPLGLWLGLATLEQFSGNVRESREIGVFLQPALDEDAARAVSGRLQADARVAGVTLRSPEQGLAELRDMSDLAGALDLLEHNPLPWVLLVEPGAIPAGRSPRWPRRSAPGRRSTWSSTTRSGASAWAPGWTSGSAWPG